MAQQGQPVILGTAVAANGGSNRRPNGAAAASTTSNSTIPKSVKHESPHMDVITRPFPWSAVSMIVACGLVVLWNIGAAVHNAAIEEEKRRDPTHVVIENDRSATHIAGLSVAGWITTVIAIGAGLGLLAGLHSARIELDIRAKTMTARRHFMPCVCRSDVRVIDLEHLDPQLVECTACTTRDKKVTCEVAIAHPVLGSIVLEDTDPVPANTVADPDAYAAAVRQQWINYLALFRRREVPRHLAASTPAFPAPPPPAPHSTAAPPPPHPPADLPTIVTGGAVVESAPLVVAAAATAAPPGGSSAVGGAHAVVVHPMELDDEIDPVL